MCVYSQTRINAGSPTAMVVDVLIAIGTAHGIVYIFGKFPSHC